MPTIGEYTRLYENAFGKEEQVEEGVLNEADDDSNAYAFAKGMADDFEREVINKVEYFRKHAKLKKTSKGFQWTLKTADGKTVTATFGVK